MATFVFDTHRAVKDLEEAGFLEAQAEALVEIVGAAVGEMPPPKATWTPWSSGWRPRSSG